MDAAPILRRNPQGAELGCAYAECADEIDTYSPMALACLHQRIQRKRNQVLAHSYFTDDWMQHP